MFYRTVGDPLEPRGVGDPLETDMDSMPPSPRYAWFLLVFLTLLNVFNFVDRQLIPSLAVLIMADLGLDNKQIGLLTGLVFALFYTSVGIYLGTRADKGNRPFLIASGLFLWSALTAATGLAANFWQMAAARVFVGVGEATLTPTSIAMLSDVFPPRRRALAAGVYYMGIPLGAGLSLVISGLMGPDLGWRNCFFILGALGVVMVVPVLMLKDPRRGQFEPTAAVADPPPRPRGAGAMFREVAHHLIRIPSLGMTILGGSMVNVAVGANSFDATWLVKERGFTLKQAGLFLGLFFCLGGVVGNLVGGLLGDLFHKRWRNGRLLFLIGAQLVLTPLAISFRLVPADPIYLALPCVFNAMLVTFYYGSVFATVQDLVPIHIRSTMLAVLVFSLNVFGVAPGAFMAGALADHFQAAGYYQPLTRALFIVGLMNLLALPLFYATSRRYVIDVARVKHEGA